MVKKKKKLTEKKAREILHHGEVRGHPLTKKQRKFMGARASGQPVKRKGKGRKGDGLLGYKPLPGF